MTERTRARQRRRGRIGQMPPQSQTIGLSMGDTLVLTRSLAPGRPAEHDHPARIGVVLSEFFDGAKPGEPIWFDDGKIGGVIQTVKADHATVEITQAVVQEVILSEATRVPVVWATQMLESLAKNGIGSFVSQ